MLSNLRSKKQDQQKDNLAGLRESFSREKEQPAVKEKSADEILAAFRPATRKVRLFVYEGCGCGGNDVEIEREVPYDSDLKDGDRVEGYEDTDEII
jgi:hypothetical protein